MTDLRKDLHIDAELITELALGIDQPEVVFDRFGYSEEDYSRLRMQDWFQKAIHARQQELEAQGFNFQSKMKMLAEDVLTDAYNAAKLSESASVKLEVGKYLAKLADLEPKQNSLQQAQGGGFSITINIPGQDDQQTKLQEKNLNLKNVTPQAEPADRPIPTVNLLEPILALSSKPDYITEPLQNEMLYVSDPEDS